MQRNRFSSKFYVKVVVTPGKLTGKKAVVGIGRKDRGRIFYKILKSTGTRQSLWVFLPTK